MTDRRQLLSSMPATKKKTLDALAESRRWRRATSKLLNKMTPKEQVTFLNRRLTGWPGASASKPSRALAKR